MNAPASSSEEQGSTPSVTFVVPLYNKGPYVAATLQSALAQGPHLLEVVVVDDGSTDDGPALVASLQSVDSRVRLVRQSNCGVAAARNAGIRHARGSHIAFLDADDILLPGFLATIVRLINRHPTAGIYATAFQRVTHIPARGSCDPSQPTGAEATIPQLFDRWRRTPPFYTCSLCIPTAVFAATGITFPQGEALGEDQDVWFRLAERYEVAYSESPLVLYRINVADSLTAGGAVKELLPCYLRLASRAEGAGYPLRHKASALKLVASHYINVARARLQAGDARGAAELLATMRALRHPTYWLRSAGVMLIPWLLAGRRLP